MVIEKDKVCFMRVIIITIARINSTGQLQINKNNAAFNFCWTQNLLNVVSLVKEEQNTINKKIKQAIIKQESH